MPRPKTSLGRPIPVRLTPAQENKLTELSVKTSRPKSSLIREAVNQFLSISN